MRTSPTGIDAQGEVSTAYGVMGLVRGQPHKQLVMVVAHEGLHAVGVKGHHDQAGIMNENGLKLAAPEDPIAWTDADREACRSHGVCQ